MKRLIVFLLLISLSFPLLSLNIAVAYRDNPNIALLSAVLSLNEEYVELDALEINELDSSLSSPLSEKESLILKNAELPEDLESILSDIDLIIVPGGVDISPELYGEKKTEGEIYNRKEDISDYLLTKAALEYDIPILGICRGMQMMAIVHDLPLITDIKPREFHRTEEGNRTYYSYHQIKILDENSKINTLLKGMESAYFPSRHHQAVKTVKDTPLSISAIETRTSIIEGIERKDKTFFVGIQFHPEWPLEAAYEGYETHESFREAEALIFFSRLFEIIEEI